MFLVLCSAVTFKKAINQGSYSQLQTSDSGTKWTFVGIMQGSDASGSDERASCKDNGIISIHKNFAPELIHLSA